MMTNEERTAARARCEAATATPWTPHYETDRGYKGDVYGRFYYPTFKEAPFDEFIGDSPENQCFADSAFLCHARTDLPAALDALDALDAEISSLASSLTVADAVVEGLEGRLEASEAERDALKSVALDADQAAVQATIYLQERVTEVASLQSQLADAQAWAAKHEALMAAQDAAIAALQAEVEALRSTLEASERWRRAYQAGKHALYAMGGAVCDAAMKNLPCGEGELDRRFTRLIEMPRMALQAELAEQKRLYKADSQQFEWAQKRIDAFEPELDRLQHENGRLRADNQRLLAERDAARADAARLLAEVEQLRAGT